MTNVCLIGCGRAGMIHARNYKGSVDHARIIAICDPSAGNLAKAQEELQVDYIYTDYREALKNEEIDAIIVVTPTEYHRDIVVEAANAKKHVFCEKPMAVSEAECDEMIQACEANGVKLQLGFMRRFDKNFRKGKAVIDSGQIGAVTMLRSNTYGPSEPKEWMYDIRSSSGPIGEVNSHDIDTLRWYAGAEVKRIYAVGRNFRSPGKAKQYPDYYDTCSVTLEFENGIIGVIGGAQYVRYGYDARAEVLGTTGIAKVGTQKADQVEVVTGNQEIHMDSMSSWTELFREAYVEEAKAFIECIRTDSPPAVSGYDGKMALILVREGLRSIQERRIIELEVV